MIVDDLFNESQLTELSNIKLAQYKKAAGADATAADSAGDTKKADKRFSGIVKATKKQFANDKKGLTEDLQADDGEYYSNSDKFFSQFEADHFDNEETSPDGMEVRGYIDGVCVMAWRFKSAKKVGGWGIYDDSALQGIAEEKVRLDPKCWTGKKIGNPKTKVKGGVRVNNCVPAESINEDGKRCMQCGMVNCSGPGDSCKCKPIKGWVPGKGFKKAIDEAANAAQQAAIAIAKKKDQGVAEGFNGEYDDEAGMAQGNLYTIAKAAQGLLDTIDDRDNLPEWAQEKIAKVEGMLVSVWNYLQSQKAQGMDPQVTDSEKHSVSESMVSRMQSVNARLSTKISALK